MTPEDSTAEERRAARLLLLEQERNARPVEAACSGCLKKRPVKYDSTLPYCVDCFPCAAGEE